MKTTTKAAHTPGSERAARALIKLNETTIFSPGATIRIAEIIDRETAAPEMLEALRRVADSVWEPDKWRLDVENAIKKAEVGQ